MTGKEIRDQLRNGRRVYGTAVLSISPTWMPYLQASGIDFVFIDTEHIPIDRHTLSWMCQAYAAANIAPLVRIPEPNPNEATKVLDGGAAGIIAPYVETVSQVRQLVGATRYRPLKGQRLQRMLQKTEEPEGELRDYLERRNQQSVLIVNIESTPALDQLQNIVSEPGLDAVLIGPHDLSCSLGVPEQYEHPRFEAAVEDILHTARAAGIGAGVHFFTGLHLHQKWSRKGENLILHSDDVHLFTETLRREIQLLRTQWGDPPPPTANSTSGLVV